MRLAGASASSPRPGDREETGVVSLLTLDIRDQSGRRYDCKCGADWPVLKKTWNDVLRLGPGDATVRTVPLDDHELPPGTYTARATCSVARDMYFIEPWLTGQRWSREHPVMQRKKKMVNSLWFGTATSNKTRLRLE